MLNACTYYQGVYLAEVRDDVILWVVKEWCLVDVFVHSECVYKVLHSK